MKIIIKIEKSKISFTSTPNNAYYITAILPPISINNNKFLYKTRWCKDEFRWIVTGSIMQLPSDNRHVNIYREILLRRDCFPNKEEVEPIFKKWLLRDIPLHYPYDIQEYITYDIAKEVLTDVFNYSNNIEINKDPLNLL